MVEAIVLPGEDLGYTLTFELENGDKAVFEETGVDYVAGKVYKYDIHLKSNNAAGGAIGSLSTIQNWEPGENYNPNPDPIDKTGEAGFGEPWSSGMFVDNSGEYEIVVNSGNEYNQYVSGDGFRITSNSTITLYKENYDGGIASVALRLKSNIFGNSSGEISSVKVGDTRFVYGSDYSTSENAGISTSIPDLIAGADFVFFSQGSEPTTGRLEIVIENTGSVSMNILNLEINGHLENNP